MAKDGQNILSSTKKDVDKNSIDKNIEIAQALNQEELNNLPASSDLQSIPLKKTYWKMQERQLKKLRQILNKSRKKP